MSASLMWSRRCLFFFLLIALAACGVRVEVSEPPLPSPTPRSYPRLNDDQSSVIRTQAEPRVVFGGETPQVNLFMTPQPSDVDLIVYRQLWVDASYDVTWFDFPQSSAQIRLNVDLRTSTDAPWEAYDRAEHNVVTANAPDSRRDSVGIGIYPEEPGVFYLRTETGLIAFPTNGEIVTRTQTRQFTVRVFSDPGEIVWDDTALYPPYEFYDENAVVLDWRGWNGGPCGLADWASSEQLAGADALSQACTAFENDEIEQMAQLMLNAPMDNVALIGAVSQMISLFAVYLGDPASASEGFTSAVSLYQEVDSVHEMTIALHNLGAVQSMLGDTDAAIQTYTRLHELRVQYYDEIGNLLTQANTAYYNQDLGSLEEVHNRFTELGSPYVQLTSRWLDTFNDG